MMFGLPTTLDVCGQTWDIRTDYRDILRVLVAAEDPDLTTVDQIYVCLRIIYKDFNRIKSDDYAEFYKAAMDFIDHGAANEGGNKPNVRTMDWEHDANILFPAVNRVAGYEVRSVEYLHWWTFIGFFMEIKDSVYSTVLSLRTKKARGKKLEKWEQEFWRDNRAICEIKSKLTEEEEDEKRRLEGILGIKR